MTRPLLIPCLAPGPALAGQSALQVWVPSPIWPVFLMSWHPPSLGLVFLVPGRFSVPRIAAWHEWAGGGESSSACVLQTCCTVQKADTGLLSVEGALSFFSVALMAFSGWESFQEIECLGPNLASLISKQWDPEQVTKPLCASASCLLV